MCVCERVCKQRNAYTRALQVDYSVMVVTAGITKALPRLCLSYTRVIPELYQSYTRVIALYNHSLLAMV